MKLVKKKSKNERENCGRGEPVKEELKCLQTGRNRANELPVVFARTQDYCQPGWCKEQQNETEGKRGRREREREKERERKKDAMRQVTGGCFDSFYSYQHNKSSLHVTGGIE